MCLGRVDFVDSFKYQPLDSSAEQVRLLWVRPASSRYDLVECSLHITKLDQDTKYVVLSQDIHSRLLHLRGLGWQWIWMEKICVNRRNPREWAEQIGMVPAIYEQALQCFRLPSSRRYVLSTAMNNDQTRRTEPLPANSQYKLPKPTNSDQTRPTELLPANRQYELSTLTSSDQIRLIVLHPVDTAKAPLHCHFNVVSLDRSPEFTLIDVNFPMPKKLDNLEAFLYCNGHPLPIQPALSPALQSLRASGVTNFWIESVCVNKDDPEDQKHHAALGGRILQKAHDKIVQRQMFHYSKLDVAKNQIRLLRISALSSASSRLAIEVITASLDEKPDYIALSYVWGSNDREYDLPCVGGNTIPITENLYLTLCELRQNSFRMVWADQICINQLDRQELSQQVCIMSRIYRQASSVVVNLGTITCDMPNPHPYQLYQAPPNQPDWLILMRILSLTRRVLLAVRPDRPSFKISEFKKFGVPPLHHKVWTSWRAVRAHPWFTRGWIIQEVAASSNVWVLCSRRLVKWEDLAAANLVIEGEVAVQGSIGGQKLVHELDHLKSYTPISPYSLLDLVSAFRDVRTSDARDKVYALRGLAADADITPRPDYTRPASQIYHEFARYCVTQGQGMSLICEAGLHRSSMDIPSWVADWGFENISSLYNCARGRGGAMLGDLENIYQHRKSMVSSEVALTSDPSVIATTGLIWDKISGVSEVFENSGTTQDRLKSFSVLDTTALALLSHLERDTSVYEEEPVIVVARTLFIESKDCVAFYQELKAQALDFQEEIGSDPLGFGYSTYLGGRLAHLNMRRFAVTEKGYMGFVPTLAEKGDRIAAFKGCRAPFVLRKKENMYVLIGDAHFSGLERVRLNGAEMENILLK
ncbi:heterokaryon incompatibility protein-domain-containing protein [Usnea florida]